MSATTLARQATLDDLAMLDEKAELIAGKVVPIMPTGFQPAIVAGRIFRRLAEFAEDAGKGTAFGDNVGFAVSGLSTERESFSPDAAYYLGPQPTNRMKFVPGPPDFAVEVRSEGDYGPAEEMAMAAKRAEYFEAGTQVVWDVDLEAGVVRSYFAGEPVAKVFGAGSEADAEPVVPGWRISVDWLLR